MAAAYALFIAARRGGGRVEEGSMEAAPHVGGWGGARRGGQVAAVGRQRPEASGRRWRTQSVQNAGKGIRLTGGVPATVAGSGWI
jgi:hypothetical protein